MAPDFKDPRIKLGYSHNVFVAKVLRKVGNDRVPPIERTSTQFAVNIILNIKGNLHGTVIISQYDVSYYPAIAIGSTYLFATNYNEPTGLYVFVSSDSYRSISEDATSSDTDLKKLAENDSEVIALQKAYPDERLRSNDVNTNTAFNSYASRHYDPQGNLIDDTVVLHEQYMATHPSAVPNASPSDSTAPAAPANAPASNPTTSPAPTDTPISSPDASISPSDTPSVSPTPTPDQVIAPTDTSTPTAAPSDSTVPAAS
jgi:hypothetical protein